MSFRLILLAAALLLNQEVARAQTPFYQGALLIQPVVNNGKCLQSQNGDANGSPVVLADCNDSVDQQFTFSNGADVPNGVNNDGTLLQIWECSSGNLNQQWWWTGDNHLSWTNHGKCLDLTNGSQANGNQVQILDCSGYDNNQIWNVGYWASNLPTTTQNGQSGINNCGTHSSASSQCQTLWINSVDDFCIWGPPVRDTIGDTETEQVAYCTQANHGSRVTPEGTFTGIHFVKTPDYVQITGQGNFTKINVPTGDEGGELDNHGADGNGNPVGGLVFGNIFGTNQQFHEWTEFISYDLFCIKACVGPNAAINCNHIYDRMGCYWNMPANYDVGVFESCDGDDSLPAGLYGTSRWYQGVSPTPAAHPAPSSSDCIAHASVRIGS